MKRWMTMMLAGLLVLGAATSAQAQRDKDQYRSHTIVVYGDSFTSGYGLEPEFAYPIILRKQVNLQFNHDRIEVINAGVSGDTAATGLSRVASILALKPTIVIVSFGATDALRKIEPNIIYNALDQILHTLTYNNIYVLLTGINAPQDANIEYAARFNSIYPELAKRYQVSFIPNLLVGVEDDWTKLQFDSIHPNEDGMQAIADTLTPGVIEMVRRINERTTR